MRETAKYLLVDGHSVLFQIGEWRALHQSNPSLARETLSQKLQHFQDTSDWLVTLVFDGTRGDAQKPEPGKIAVLYSSSHSTADSIIEKIVAKHPHPQQITVITADRTEQNTVESLGAFSLSPNWLTEEIKLSETAFQDSLKKIQKKSQW